MSKDTLTIDIAEIPRILIPKFDKIVIRHEYGEILLKTANKLIKLNTITAHRIGYTIAMAVPKLEYNEMIVLNINGEKLELLGPIASKVSTALLRKADDADDWQLINRRKHA